MKRSIWLALLLLGCGEGGAFDTSVKNNMEVYRDEARHVTCYYVFIGGDGATMSCVADRPACP